MKLARIAFRNIRRNTRRSVLSASAAAVASMAVVMMFALIGGMKADMENNISRFYTGNIRIRHAEFDENENLNPIHLRITDYERLLSEIRRYPEVTAVSPRIPFPAAIYRDENTNRAMGIGIDFTLEEDFMGIERILYEGAVPEAGTNGTLIGAALAKELGVGIGDRFTVLATTMRRGSNAMTFTVTGLVRFPVGAMNATHFLVPIDRAQRLLQMDGSTTEILVMLVDARAIDTVKETIRGTIAADGFGDLSVKDWTESNVLLAYFRFAEAIYAYIGLIFFLLASTVLINTTMMIIFERMREIGTIAAMGMKGNEIVRLFFMETVFLAVIGTFVGIVIGVIISLVFSVVGIDMTEALAGIDFEVSNIIYPKINVTMTIFIFFYAVAVCSLASLFPSRRAARIQPVEALRHI